MRKRCNGCGGEFDDLTAEGLAYFHVCAPIVGVRVRRNGEATIVPLGDVLPTDTLRVLRAGVTTQILASDMQAGDVRIDDREIRRPAGVHRDETPIEIGVRRSERPRRQQPMREEGAGVTDLP